MLIDTHAHLNFKAFKKDLNQVLKRAHEAGVEKIIVVGTDLKTSQKAIELAQRYECLYASVGIHPHHLNNLDKNKLEEKLVNLANKKKVVAIGETGLDYHQYQNSKYGKIKITKKVKDLQKNLFALHLKLAGQLDLPLIIHCRQALDDLLDALTLKANTLKRKGVFHCFEGNKINLNKVLALGFFLGFDGNVTYKSDIHLRDLVKEAPVERLLLETDSPFLTPEPLRGTRNEPKNIKLVVKALVDLKNISFKKLEEKTTHNSYSLFKFH